VQPFDRTLFQGGGTLLVGKASAAPRATYQWLHNGSALPGATNDSLQITDAQFSQAGAYQLVVSNRYGATATRPAKVAITFPLPIALDATNLTWSTSNGFAWYGQPSVTHDGEDAGQSADISHGQESIVQTTVTGPGQLSFWWKVSSEAGFDQLQFRINGVVQTNISGDVDWEPQLIPIGAGVKQLQWRYAKDGSSSAGFDAAWLDQVSYVPDPPVFILHPQSQTVGAGVNVSLTASASGAGPIHYQWQHQGSNVTLPSPNSGLSLNSVGRADKGEYRVLASNAGGTTASSNAFLMVVVPQRLAEPVLLPNGMIQVSSGDADGGVLSQADLDSFILQTSSNLVDWTELPGVLFVTNGMIQFQDPTTNAAVRFYRIVESWQE